MTDANGVTDEILASVILALCRMSCLTDFKKRRVNSVITFRKTDKTVISHSECHIHNISSEEIPN